MPTLHSVLSFLDDACLPCTPFMLTAPDPGVSKPQCRQNMKPCSIRTTVCYCYTDENVIWCILCILSTNIPVTTLIKHTYKIVRIIYVSIEWHMKVHLSTMEGTTQVAYGVTGFALVS